MPTPISLAGQDLIVVQHRWRDLRTLQGYEGEVEWTPVPYSGQSLPNLIYAAGREWMKASSWTTRPDPLTGYMAVPLPPYNDPDLTGYVGVTVSTKGEQSLTVEVPFDADLTEVTEEMADALSRLDIPVDVEVGAQVRAVWLTDLATTSPAPTPPSLFWTTAQTMAAILDTVDIHDQDPQAHQDLRGPRPPTGGAGGVLSGTYPNPGFAVNMATQAELAGKQPLDADLTAIAGLDSSTSGAIASDGSGWIKKTYAQLKAALGLTKSDVGLGNVDNTPDASKPVSTAQQSAINSASVGDRNRANHTGTQLASSISDLPETVQDIVAAFIVNGDNVTVAYDDAANTFTINAVGGGGGGGSTDPEVVRDTIGATLVNGANISITVDDPGNTITVAVTGLATVATTGSYNDLSNKPATGVSSVNTRSGAVTGLAEASDLTAHTSRTDNPHSTTKAQVGLGNVDNTSDAAKPVSTAQQTALDGKAPTTRQLTAGTGLSGGGDLSADRSFAVAYGTTTGTAAQGNDARLSDQRTPLDSSVTNAKVATGAAIDEAKLALASDAVAGTPSRRTLGTGAQQATAGNDSRLSDQRAWSLYDATNTPASGQVPAWNGTKYAPITVGGNSYTPTAQKNAAYTASPGELVMVDASGGPVTITAPASGAGRAFGVKKLDPSANVVTIAAAGSDTIGSQLAATFPLRTNDQATYFAYNPNAATNWVATHNHLSLASLDLRYPATVTVPAAERTVTGNTTAVSGETLRVNASGGAITVTPPTSPAAGSRVFLVKTDSTANTVTWLGTVSGDTGGVVLGASGAGVTLIYSGGGWMLESTTTAAAGRVGSGSAPAAAGSRSGLYDARTNTYMPHGGALRVTRGHLARVAQPSSTQLVEMVCLGDSRTVGYFDAPNTPADSYPSQLRARMAAAGYPSAGTGLVMAASNGALMDARITVTGSWTPQYPYRAWGASGATATFTSDVAGAVVEVYYYTNSGTFTVKVGAGAAVPVSPVGGTSVTKYSVNATVAVGTQITVTSTSAAGYLIGFCVRNTSGLLIHSVAYGGLTSTALATTGAITLQGITSYINPSILGVMIGVNDPPSSIPATTTATNLSTILTTNNPNSTKFLIVQSPNPSYADSWGAYVSAMYDAADTGRPLLDLNDRFVNPTLGTAAGLLGSDNTHETIAGANDIARAVTTMLTP